MADLVPPPRRKVDLRHLPRGTQYVIALTVVAVVVAAAWIVGQDRPVPTWITRFLVPALGVLYLVLTSVAVGSWLRRRRGPRA
jgi:peptidoglycan/LPS O-acetylase OafA/YrhL